MKENQLKLSIDDAVDVLKAIHAPYQEKWYENDCITDYSRKPGKNPYQAFIFLRVFDVHKTKAGNLAFRMDRVMEEVSARNPHEMDKKVYALAEACEGMVPTNEAANREWMPEKWQNIKKALKVFRLLHK
jgi:hypothetical protein